MEVKQNLTNIPSKPGKVMLAARFLYISLGIVFLTNLIQAIQALMTSFTGFPIIRIISIRVISMLLFWYLIYMVGKKQNWARIALLVIIILGIPSILPQVLAFLTNPMQSLVSILQTSIQIFSVVLLFQESSSEWFRDTKDK